MYCDKVFNGILKDKFCCREKNFMIIFWKLYMNIYVVLFYDIKMLFDFWSNKFWYVWYFEERLKGRMVNLFLV